MVAGDARAVIARNGTLTNNGGGPVAQSDLFLIGANDVELTNITSTGFRTAIANSAAVFVSGSTGVEMNDVDVDGLGGTPNGIAITNSSQDVEVNGSDVANVVSVGVILSQVTDVTFQGAADPFTITNTGSTGLYIADARNTHAQNGTITNTGGTGAAEDAGGILVQGVVGRTTDVWLSNIRVIGADSPNAEAYGVAAIAIGAPSQVNLRLDDVHVDGGAGITTTRGFFFIDSGPTILSGTGNTTSANVPDACHKLGTLSGSVEINGNSEPGTTC
jgi:hypothetical protein